MVMNPVIAMLHNSASGRWHPIVFSEALLPGPDRTVVRHKSKGHHTTGFDSKELAESHVRDDLAKRLEGATLALGTVFEWDGTGVPAIVHFFDHQQPGGAHQRGSSQ